MFYKMFDLKNLAQGMMNTDGLMFLLIIILVVIGFCFLIFLTEGIGKALILKKSGESWWKVFIPIYGDYTLCKISGTNYIWLMLLGGCFVLTFIEEEFSSLFSIVNLLYRIVLASSLSKCFGKGTGTTVGLVLLPGIFYLVLGCTKNSYLGPVGCKDPFFENVSFGKTKNSSNTTNINNQTINNTPKYQFCHTCGHALTEFDRFCPGCGREL